MLYFNTQSPNCQNICYSEVSLSCITITSLISTEIMKSANKISYDSIWKFKDKVKRRALTNIIENGGLIMIHLDSLIQSQKVFLL